MTKLVLSLNGVTQGEYELNKERFTIGRKPENEIQIDNLAVKAGDLTLEGKVAFDAEEPTLWRASLATLRFGRSNLSASLRNLDGGGYEISLEGKQLDIEPLLLGNDPEPREVPSKEGKDSPPLIVNVNVDKVRIGPSAGLGPVEARGRYDGVRWQSVLLEGEVGNGRVLRVSFVPEDDGHRLEIHSEDAGRTLRALGWSDKMEGGILAVSGKRASVDAPLAGGFKLTGYKLSKAPALARLLQVASLTGIFDALGQRGLDFVSFDGTFEYRDGSLTIADARAYGSSLGITVEGSIDLDDDSADLRGTLVPAYTVNQVLGKIPILGPLLTGGKDEGVRNK